MNTTGWLHVLYLLGVATTGATPPGAEVVTIHGRWSPWTNLETDCVRINDTSGEILDPSVQCGGGVKLRTRSCTNPVPQGVAPKECPGSAIKAFACNTEPCGLRWGNWSACSANCSRGIQKAHTECQAHPGDPWVDCSTMEDDSTVDFEWIRDCNHWNKSSCPSPCEGYSCPDFAQCIDLSTDEAPQTRCQCQMGRVFLPETGHCILPLPPGPTPRAIPVLPESVKTATTAATKSASSLLVILVGGLLWLFAVFRIYDSARILQMNMEMALLLAHLCLIVPDRTSRVEVCRMISILTHFFFLACFMFMFLEALHVYAMVASVVHKDGMFTKLQNIVLGWGISAGIVLICIAMEYQHYGGAYHCWLQMDTNLVYAQFIPLLVLAILIFTLLEAAGNASANDPWPQVDDQQAAQLTSAKIMQRTGILIMPMVLASFICGTVSEYDQNVYMYGIFTALNGVLGGMILVMHSSANEKIRNYLGQTWKQLVKKD